MSTHRHRQLSRLLISATPFTGRTSERIAVERRIAHGARSIAIVGPAGVGKTRLALACAEIASERFADGWSVAPLSTVSDVRLVPIALARSLGIPLTGSRAPERELIDALAPQQFLLVIDTFEHVLPAAPLLGELLNACPGLSIIVTSRAQLPLPVELELALETLPIPTSDEVDALLASDALRLFEARARAVSEAFSLTAQNAATVAAICRRVDGLPLAIELAAAQTGALPPSVILARINADRALPGPRDAEPRHRSMRDAIRWSYNLLTPNEQVFFRLLSTLESACGAERIVALARLHDPDARDAVVQNDLARLLRASMLVRTPGPSGEPLFGLLRVMRDFGREQARAIGETERFAALHAIWTAEQLELEQPTGLIDLRTEIRAAVAHAITADDRQLLDRLLVAIGRDWIARGLYTELREWLDFAVSGTTPPSPGTLMIFADLQLRQGALSGARDTAGQVADAAGDDRRVLADAALVRAAAAARLGDHEFATEQGTLAMRLLSELGADERMADARVQLAHLAMFRRDLAAAEREAQTSAQFWADRGEPERSIDAIDMLSLIARLRGDSPRQSAYAAQAVTWASGRDDPYAISSALWTAAAIAFERGRYNESARCFGAEVTVRAAAGFALDPAYIGEYDASISTLRGMLGSVIFAAETDVGARMSAQDALAFARSMLNELATSEADARRAEHRALAEIGLSDRQQEVLRLIGQGKSDREIAEMLSISVRTVSKHVEAILVRLETHTRSGAAALAARIVAGERPGVAS
jgi:non-specific serine/threonine protein kinase